MENSQLKPDHGIKELKELIDGMEVLFVFLMHQAKDGLDWGDAAALGSKLVGDEEFRNKLIEAFSGLKEMSDETLDLDIHEGIELIQYVLQKIK